MICTTNDSSIEGGETSSFRFSCILLTSYLETVRNYSHANYCNHYVKASPHVEITVH